MQTALLAEFLKFQKLKKIYFTPVVSDAVATPKEDNFSLSLTKDSYYN